MLFWTPLTFIVQIQTFFKISSVEESKSYRFGIAWSNKIDQLKFLGELFPKIQLKHLIVEQLKMSWYLCVSGSSPRWRCGWRWTAGPGRSALSWRGLWSRPRWGKAERRGMFLRPAGWVHSKLWSTKTRALSKSLAEGLKERWKGPNVRM